MPERCDPRTGQKASLRRLTRFTTLLLLVCLVVPADARSARSLYNQGREAEQRENYVGAFEAYEAAFNEKPGEVRYRVAMQRTRFLAASQLVSQGQALREGGQLENALAHFQRALAIDPSSFIAQQEIRRTRAMIESKAPPDPEAALAPPPRAMSPRIEQAREPMELAAIPDKPIRLKLTEDSRVIFETIGKLAGINVLFDPDYQSRRIRIELTDITLEEALAIVALETKTFWRPVTPNTIFVAADTPAKRRELEQQVLRMFYLGNLSQATDLQEIVNAIRTLLEAPRVLPVQSQSAIIFRGTPDQVALAEKIIHDIDKARPEVVVEVAVMQVRRDRLRQLGFSPPTRADIGLRPTVPTTGTGTGTPTTTPATSGITLQRLANLTASDFVVTIPDASLRLLANDSSTKLLQNPQIRALDGQKASLKIGDRVPVAVGSFQPGIGGVGINPLVNTQFQYIDVGVNIDITPRVHAGREVSLKVMLDVSSVTARVNIGGIEQPVIGQRRIEHDIRLKEGEVNLLGGILEEQDVRSISGIPGLSQIPILRYLFSSESKERAENEIVFAIIPRLVRQQELSDLNVRALEIGTGTAIDLRRAPRPRPQPEAQPAAAPPQAQLQPPVVRRAPATPEAAPPTAPPATAPEPATGPGRAMFLMDPPILEQSTGATFTVDVKVIGQNIYAVPLQIGYDPALLQLINVSNGDFLSRDGQAVALVHRPDEERGILQLSGSRPPGVGGVSGEGTVFTLTFLARQAGEGRISIVRAAARGPNMEPIPAAGSEAVIQVK